MKSQVKIDNIASSALKYNNVSGDSTILLYDATGKNVGFAEEQIRDIAGNNLTALPQRC